MEVTVTDEMLALVHESFERFLLRRALDKCRRDLDEYRRDRRFEISVCFDDALPMTDLGEAGA